MANSESEQNSCAFDCPCLNLKCGKRGNCIECIRMHRKKQSHLPECLHPMLRDLVATMAAKLELKISDGRPAASLAEARKRGEKVY